MAKAPRVCVKALRAPLLAAAARSGRPLPELAASVGVAPALLGDATARVPHALAIQVWEAMAAATSDETFGLFAAQLVGGAPFDLVDLALAHAPDLDAMAVSFARYQTLFHDANDAYREERGDRVGFGHRFRGDIARSRHLTEFILGVWVVKGRRAVGQPYPIEEVHLRHPAPRDTAPYRRLFGVEPEFGADEDALVLTRATLGLPLVGADPLLARTLVPQLDHELRALGGTIVFVDDVREQIRTRLADGDAMIDEVARALAMSERTMQRRLRDAGTGFRAVLDEARREVALAQLGRGANTVTDVAFLLGFSDLSAFARAFRRWTGSNPARYRAGAAI